MHKQASTISILTPCKTRRVPQVLFIMLISQQEEPIFQENRVILVI